MQAQNYFVNWDKDSSISLCGRTGICVAFAQHCMHADYKAVIPQFFRA